MPLMNLEKSHLLVIDIQSQLIPSIVHANAVSTAALRLVTLSQALGVGCTLSEHYPRGLGPTVPEVRHPFPDNAVFEKISFSCAGDAAIGERFAQLKTSGTTQLILCGLETHICVLQSAIDFQEQGFDVFVAIDATSARSDTSHRLGIDRLRRNGVDIVNSDMIVFEWLQAAGTDAFRRALPIIKTIPA